MKALIDAPRPLPALRLARRLERFLPADRDGLLFTLPLRAHADAVWNAGKPRLLLPSTQSVDAAGTYFDPRTDLITSALANRLRIGGIDQATKKQGALFEGARTNTCLQSEAFGVAPWTKLRSTIGDDATAAPDGALTADELVEDSTAGQNHLVEQFISVVSGQNIAFSVFAKKNTRTEIKLWMEGQDLKSVWFDLDAGTKGTVGASVVASGMDDLGNGWYRCWVVAAAASTEARRYAIALGSGGETFLYNGDGSSGLYLWGAQCEQNVEYPTSYSKTTTASVTRAADDIDYDNIGEVNAKAAAGTAYIAETPQYAGTEGGFHYLFDILTADNNEGFYVLRHGTSGTTQLFVRSGGLTVATVSDPLMVTRGTTYVWAFVWAVNDFRVYRDGEFIASDTAGAAPAAMHSKIVVGQAKANNNQADAHLSHLHVYDSVHDAARILQNSNEIKAWLGI